MSKSLIFEDGRSIFVPPKPLMKKKSMHDVVDVVVITMQENIVEFFSFWNRKTEQVNVNLF